MEFSNTFYYMKLSIIIPVYNVEKYLESCLDSVMNQEHVSKDDFEVIIVNDGSQDSCANILLNYNWQSLKYKIITQTTTGLSAARNVGFRNAIGNYVWFVDSDDRIKSYAVNTIFEHIINSEFDVINIGYNKIIDGVEQKQSLPLPLDSGKELLVKGYSHEAQFHIFKRDFLINYNLYFKEGIFHEDTEFTPRCLYLASQIGIISKSLYEYRIRTNSIMSTINPKRAFDCIDVALSLIAFSNKNGENLKTSPLVTTICLCINNALHLISKCPNEKRKDFNTKYRANSVLTKTLSSSSILKYRLEGLMFSLFPSNPVMVYQILQKIKK